MNLINLLFYMDYIKTQLEFVCDEEFKNRYGYAIL